MDISDLSLLPRIGTSVVHHANVMENVTAYLQSLPTGAYNICGKEQNSGYLNSS